MLNRDSLTPIYPASLSDCLIQTDPLSDARLTRVPLPRYVPAVSPAYLSQKLTRPLVTKDGGTLCTVLDARTYMLALRKRREFITLLAARNSNCYCFRSFGFEFQGPCSAFTSWRARKRDPKTFSLPAHNQELVLGHVTFVLQQLFQISLERGLCFNHRIERLLHRGRQIICIDVLPLQFFPCHCLAPNALTKLKVLSPHGSGRRLFCGKETPFFAVTTSASAMRVLRAPRSIES